MSFVAHIEQLPALIRDMVDDAAPADLIAAYLALSGRIPERIHDMLDNEYEERPGGTVLFYGD